MTIIDRIVGITYSALGVLYFGLMSIGFLDLSYTYDTAAWVNIVCSMLSAVYIGYTAYSAYSLSRFIEAE